PAIFVVLWSTGFIGTKLCAAQRRAADLSRNPHGPGGWADGCYRRGRAAAMAGSYRHRPQRRRGHSGARILSGRDRDRDRAFDPRRALRADSGSATDPDLDPGEPLARRTRHAAAMDRAVAGARRRGADPARSPDERGGGMGLAGLGRVAGQHHPGNAVPEALLRPDRLAFGKSRAIYRGDGFLRHRRGAVGEQCGALDQRVHAVADLACGGAVDRIDRAIVLADPALGGHRGGEPVLSGAGGDRGHGLCAVRRAARYDRNIRHGCLRRRGVPGQPARVSQEAQVPKQKPPDSHLKASARLRKRLNQRFDFLAFLFFLAAFLTAFLADFFAEDFLAAFLAFLAFFGAAFFAAFLAAFFFFLTAGLAATFGAAGALVIGSVVGAGTGCSSSILVPQGLSKP